MREPPCVLSAALRPSCHFSLQRVCLGRQSHSVTVSVCLCLYMLWQLFVLQPQFSDISRKMVDLQIAQIFVVVVVRTGVITYKLFAPWLNQRSKLGIKIVCGSELFGGRSSGIVLMKCMAQFQAQSKCLINFSFYYHFREGLQFYSC